MRESYLNYVLLLIALDQTKIISVEELLGDDFDFIKEGENLIEKI